MTLSSLRARIHLATISSELCVRRLLWLRSALLAEQHGQLRLDLATLFGTSPDLQNSVNHGMPTSFAPKFLHISYRDLLALTPDFSGFHDDWKQVFLDIPAEHLRSFRSFVVNEAVPPVEPDPPPAAEVVFSIVCDMCGEGPWKNLRALRTHKVRKHLERNPVQTTSCTLCGRQFTSKTAAQRHTKNQSCGRPVTNHGHAGAIAGQRVAAAAAASVAQAPPVQPIQQPTLHSFFVRDAGPRLPHSNEPNGPSSQARSSRSSWEHPLPGLGPDRGGLGQATPEGVPACVRSRPDTSRARCVGNTHIHPGQRLRAGHPPDGAHGEVETATSSQRASSSRGTSATHAA